MTDQATAMANISFSILKVTQPEAVWIPLVVITPLSRDFILRPVLRVEMSPNCEIRKKLQVDPDSWKCDQLDLDNVTVLYLQVGD